MNKQYLGDGVYADSDGQTIILTAENGLVATDIIHLEPEVLRLLDIYREKVLGKKE